VTLGVDNCVDRKPALFKARWYFIMSILRQIETIERKMGVHLTNPGKPRTLEAAGVRVTDSLWPRSKGKAMRTTSSGEKTFQAYYHLHAVLKALGSC
jgi:hypothetical protein